MLTVLFIGTFSHSTCAQNNTQEEDKSSLVLDHLFSSYREKETPKKRVALSISEDKKVARLNPLMYVASGMLFVYQNVFSEQISAVCTYEISCSEITKKSIEREGLFKGILIGFHQLTNCSPSLLHDHEEHSISDNDKIINSFHYD